jgi:adhesin transport system membrane fusion protein
VIYISADSTKSDNARPDQMAPYYTIRVKCDPVSMDSKKMISLMPGMEASVDVIIGERTIAEYFFRPIQNVVSNSLKGK